MSKVFVVAQNIYNISPIYSENSPIVFHNHCNKWVDSKIMLHNWAPKWRSWFYLGNLFTPCAWNLSFLTFPSILSPELCLRKPKEKQSYILFRGLLFHHELYPHKQGWFQYERWQKYKFNVVENTFTWLLLFLPQ